MRVLLTLHAGLPQSAVMRSSVLVIASQFFCLVFLPICRASIPEIRFATIEEGRRELARKDEFVSKMSAFDRSGRLKTSKEVDQAEYLQFVQKQVLGWPEDDRAKVQAAWALLKDGLAPLQIPKVESVLIIRTTGEEEGGAAYTRGRSIILPGSKLDDEPTQLAGLLAHELFHICSRSDTQFRDRLYKLIGFEPCPEVVLPSSLAAQRITNPDAPVWAHAITVEVDGRNLKVVPILVASVKTYPENERSEFFHFLSLRFWPLAHPEGPPALLSISQLKGFVEQVGQNTNYIIHPEEILADNFKLIVLGVRGRSPELLDKIKAELTQAR